MSWYIYKGIAFAKDRKSFIFIFYSCKNMYRRLMNSMLEQNWQTKLSNTNKYMHTRGGSSGGAPGARPPKIGKNMIFWRKIVIFHTKYPNNFALPSTRRNIFKCAPPNLKSWIRPCIRTSRVNRYRYQKILRVNLTVLCQHRLL